MALSLTGCAPAYYGSIVWDVETTLACSTCSEGNPLVPETKSRVILYGYSALVATTYTLLVKKVKNPKYRKLLYATATFFHSLAGTLNLRYVKY